MERKVSELFLGTGLRDKLTRCSRRSAEVVLKLKKVFYESKLNFKELGLQNDLDVLISTNIQVYI